MAQPLLFLCFLSLMLFVNGDPFDYFQLVQQWPPNTCNSTRVSKCYAPPPLRFTIHGLWPSNYTNAHLVCLRKNFTEIAALEPQLMIYWPDVICGNHLNFWEHEWDNHGICSEPPFDVFQYFNISLNLRTDPNYDLLAILIAAGLSPNNSKGLKSQDIQGPIEAATGKKPGIRCNKNGKNKKLQLHEIVLCFDKDGDTLIDCPQHVSSNCPSKFVWHHLQQNSVGIVGIVHMGKVLFISISLLIAVILRRLFRGF